MTTPTLEKNELSTNYLEIFKSDNSKLVQLTEHMIQTNEVKTPLEFAKKFMFTFDSKEPFPINIEVLIEMKVYDLVGNIKKKLNKNFILDTDFKVQNLTCENSQVKKTHGGARHKENIMLTVDCFKSMCMLANSETGKQVKKYLLSYIKETFIPISHKENKELSVSQSSDIVEFKLTLKNNTELSIPVSKDGYVNVTKLCQAGGKRIDNWIRLKQSKELLEAYSNLPHIPDTEKAIPHIRGIEISRVIKGGNVSLQNSGTYYPMDIAIQIAQWVDPYFAIQVSRWTRELLLFGSVTLGQEKSSQELENKFQEQIKVLTQEKEKLSQEHSKLVLNHEKLLKRRNRTDYETGNVVYIISHEAFSIAYKCNYFKFGKSTQKGDETRACFKQRLSTYNTGAPVNYNVHYLLYVDNNALIEEIIKEKFSKQLDPLNKEWIKELSLETIILFIQSLMELMNISYKEVMLDPVVYVSTDKKSIELVETVEFETDTLDKPDFSKILEEIDKYTDKKLRVLLKEYNLTQSGLKDDKKNRLKNHILKGCTSVCEKCDENKELTELNFRKTQIGFVKVCLECEKKECEKTLLYRKHVHTEITQGVKTKVCPGCKTEKIYDDFHKNKGNRDGLVSRCKNCESSRKSVVVNVALKKVAPKVELGKKWCPKCEKIKENCNFRNAVSRPDGLQHSCKECENETMRRNRKINKL